MKKTSTLFYAIAGLFSLIFLLPFVANAQDEEQGIKLTRFINPPVINPGSTVTVNVFIDKSYRGGLARLDEFLPRGFTASEGDKNGSTFSIDDSIVKFSWEDMPADPGFTVSYQLHIPITAVGNYTLRAQFIFVTSAGAVAAYFKPYTFTVVLPQNSNSPVAANPPKDTAVKAIAVAARQNPPPAVAVAPALPIHKADSVPAKTVAVVPAKAIVTKAPAAPAPLNKTPAVVATKLATVQHPPIAAPKATAAPAPKPFITRTVIDPGKPNGLWYRVQIMASAIRLDVDSVIINGVRDKLYIITYNGISRYYVGAFHSLQPAIDYRNKIINSGLKDPFVVAYKDGTKIPIKEALQVVATN